MESHNFEDVKFVVQACVNSKRNGIPLEKLDAEFAHFYGSSIPYANFGFSNLKSYLYSLPDIYIEGKNVIFCSEKSRHITKLVHSAKYEHSQNKNLFGNSVLSEAEFSKLEQILPLFYNHQAMGDDFFLDMAANHFGCYLPPNDLSQCGLCVHNQTIRQLIKRINNSKCLAPKAVIMIGMADILKGRSMKSISKDLKTLICTLKNKKVDVTLFTIIRPSTNYFNPYEKKRIKIYNNMILKYKYDTRLNCKVVDINNNFRKSRCELNRVLPKNDIFHVLTHTEKQIFVKVLRKYLTKNL